MMSSKYVMGEFHWSCPGECYPTMDSSHPCPVNISSVFILCRRETEMCKHFKDVKSPQEAHNLEQWVLNLILHTPLPQDISRYPETRVADTAGGAIGIRGMEARGAATRATRHRTAPAAENDTAQNVSSAKLEKA